jgi:hypothetical protein
VTELYSLLIVLILICLAECICYASDGTIAFRVYRKHAFKIAEPLFRIDSLGLNVFLSSPVPGQGEIVFCASEPRIGPEGICICNLPARGNATGFIPYSELQDLKRDGTKLYSGSHLIARTGSEARAQDLLDILRRLVPLEVEGRSSAIRQEFRRMLAVDVVKERLGRFRHLTKGLCRDARILLVTLVVLLPGTMWAFGWRRALPVLLLCLFVCFRQIATFVRVHRIFHTHLVAERRVRALGLALSPPAAVRSGDVLMRDLLASFHPLAVARATGCEASSRAYVSKTLRQLFFPAEFEKPDAACPVAVWVKHEWLSTVRDWAAAEFGDIQPLVVTPSRKYTASLSYCPRCLEEFVQERTECPDCPGVLLSSFDGS